MPDTTQDATTVVRLRLGVGVIAAALPFLVLFGNMAMQRKVVWIGSISTSYYTPARGIFAGSMCVIGAALIAYRYDKPDNRAGNLAGFLAIVVALFPTAPDYDIDHKSSTAENVVGTVHFVAATGLFVTLAYFCFFLFTRSAPGMNAPGSRKAVRNRLYRVCGSLIVLGLLGAGLTFLVLTAKTRAAYNTLFWFETVMVLSFALGWLVKGGALLKDSPAPGAPTGDTAIAPTPGVPTGV